MLLTNLYFLQTSRKWHFPIIRWWHRDISIDSRDHIDWLLKMRIRRFSSSGKCMLFLPSLCFYLIWELHLKLRIIFRLSFYDVAISRNTPRHQEKVKNRYVITIHVFLKKFVSFICASQQFNIHFIHICLGRNFRGTLSIKKALSKFFLCDVMGRKKISHVSCSHGLCHLKHPASGW